MTTKRKSVKQNRRLSTSRQRRQQHLLDVKVRARKASARRIQKAFFVVSVLFILLSIVGAILFGARRALDAVFFANPDYALRTIEVTTDGELGRDAVLRAAGVEEGRNIFSVNLSAIEDKIRALPQVEGVDVHRLLPDRLVITIQERRPIAWIASTDANKSGFNYDTAYLVDQRGIVLKPKASAPEYMTLPIVIGIDLATVTIGRPIDKDSVKAALELIHDCSEILQSRFQIATIDVSKDYSLVVSDKQGSMVTFGLDELVGQLHRLSLLLNYCEQNSKDLQSANLMVERNIPVVFHEPETVGTSSRSPVVGPGTPSIQPADSPGPQPTASHSPPQGRSDRKAEKPAGGAKPARKKLNTTQAKPING